MKKLLLVNDAWHPQVNGVVRVTETLIATLANHGWEVEVVHPGQFMTMPLPTYPEIRLALLPGRRIAKRLARRDYDAVHVMTEGPLGFAARRACLRRGIPFTTWYHSHFQLYVDARLRGLLRPVNWFLRRFHNAAARVFVSTPTLKKTLEADGFKNLVVVPLGVDVELFKRNLAPNVPELTKPVFCYFSRLSPEKSPEEFFKLDLPGTKVVIGDGPGRAKYEKKYPDAVFVGYKKGQELVDWLSRADVMVFPSRTETFGLVALEAMACGVPVAAHDVMGPRDIITNGVDGFLSNDLGDAAKKCLALNRDACRATALRYSWEHSAEEFVKQLVTIN
jgi:glycosyltransferase involved in cell wall biosynthesis